MRRRTSVHRAWIAAALCAPYALSFGAPPGNVSLSDPEVVQAIAPLPTATQDLIRRLLSERQKPVDTVERDETGDGARPVPRAETDDTARFKAGDTLLIRFAPVESDAKEVPTAPPFPKVVEPSREEKERLELRKARLPKQQTFVLDLNGVLTLPHVGRIPLAGLSEDEAAERIAAEPEFEGLEVRVRYLPVERELRPFGYELFSRAPKTFAPATDIPVPADYVLGPGDTVVVQLYGKDNIEHTLSVTREGVLLFPGIGPITVAGKKFSRLQSELQARVQRQLIGTRAAVSLGRLRSIRVFVLGDVEQPGSYTVSSLATLTNALLVSGGVRPHGSLRDVQHRRGGQLVGTLDLYDLLLHGDTSRDARLLPGDVIFVPPLKRTVGISGRVRRPAIYEIKGERTVGELIALAGGLLPDADPQSAQLERIAAQGARRRVTLDLSASVGRQEALENGDVVRVLPVLDRIDNTVTLTGYVERSGAYAWHTGMRLSDLLPTLSLLQPEADPRFVLIVREDPANGTQLRGASLAEALAHPGGEADVMLAPGDEVVVFDRREDRAALIRPLLERARASATPERPSPEVGIEGSVHHAGRYPWSPGMSVRDLLNAAGGLTDRAHLLEAELTRYVLLEGQAREQSRRVVDLRRVHAGNEALRLEPYDRLVVRRVPRWQEEGAVEILGEVKFPGKYPIAPGERLSSVLRRAGGLTEMAYARAAVFLRESVRAREQEYLERLTSQLERDLALVSQGGPEIGVRKEAALAEGQALLRQMRGAKATGRMVVKLEEVLNARDDYDVVMQPGDRLVVPQRPDEVTVIGEVYHPTSHIHVDRYTRDSYVKLSGGVTERGNRRAAYVVHADGSVSPPGGWFGGDVAVGPGDTVIVPLKVDRISSLKIFTDVSTILFQLAVTAAALDSIGIL
ncbi:polysaccharide export protein [Sulfurifustis variabilis]|uniref:Polysaccharide export protein n=1 Tax=Sulfurifustis variabilis TaxID=1675686 RepID=A0A1B4V3I4_9GAMM|nr:SLBB domain-containing protein [Sulfurifustis variabilis]BAU48119.1 polysaccharide export protein [Sulfurifustis variabilis]